MNANKQTPLWVDASRRNVYHSCLLVRTESAVCVITQGKCIYEWAALRVRYEKKHYTRAVWGRVGWSSSLLLFVCITHTLCARPLLREMQHQRVKCNRGGKTQTSEHKKLNKKVNNERVREMQEGDAHNVIIAACVWDGRWVKIWCFAVICHLGCCNIVLGSPTPGRFVRFAHFLLVGAGTVVCAKKLQVGAKTI